MSRLLTAALIVLVILAILWFVGIRLHVSGATSPQSSRFPPRAAILTTRTSDFCSPGWAAAHRHVTEAQRTALFAAAGITDRTGWIVDHRISLEVGGSNATVNLMLQRRAAAAVKDTLENLVHRLVCAGNLSVRAGQLRLWRWSPPPVAVTG